MRQFYLYVAVIAWLGVILSFSACKEDEPEEKIFLNIELTELPERTAFQLGEVPDFTGLEVAEVYTDGTKKPIRNYDLIRTENIFKRGPAEITVSARNRTATFDISIEGDLVDTNLPVVYIETENQAPVESKETYVNANMVIKDKGNVLTEATLRIKGRGNATWTYPKKPYKLKLNNKTDILGMGADKDWVLLANYCDKTLLRTGVALKVSQLMNFPWTIKDRFVEVVLNGEYLGNYQLVEGIKQDSKRVDIPKDGFLFEKDGYYLQEPRYFVSSRGYGYSFKNPDPEEDLTDEQWNYIKNYVDEFEAVLASDVFADPVAGYSAYIDTESFARWFLFQNILANMDTNVYLTKSDQSNSKLCMGPVWDFEWSLGIGWYDGARPRPAAYYVWNSGFYFDRLLADPVFKSKVRETWSKLNITDDILKYIEDTRKLIGKSQELNFKRWDIMNVRVSVGGIPMGSFDKEVECDRQFFINRINWLNGELSKY